MVIDDITELDSTGDDQGEDTLFGPLARLAPPAFVPQRAARGALAPAGDRPSEDEVREYLTTLADSYGLPRELVHAVAQTESGLDPDAGNANGRTKDGSTISDALANPPAGGQKYGVMQVNEQHIGKTVPDANGMPFTIGDEIKTDWKANAKAGVALLAEQHELAQMEQGPGSMPEDRAQQACSAYTAGAENRTRYLEQRADGLPAEDSDRTFLRNYREASASGGQDGEQGENIKPAPQGTTNKGNDARPRDETPIDLTNQQGKLPRPEQVIQETRESPEYKALGPREGNKKAQMLFDALAQKFGNMAATYFMARFAESGDSRDDFAGFKVGTKPGRHAARHFFWSAVITGESNSALAWLAGVAKEGYDALGQTLRRVNIDVLPGAGTPAREDLAANAAGRTFARELHRRQHALPFLQLDRSHVNLSDYTQF